MELKVLKQLKYIKKILRSQKYIKKLEKRKL